LIRGNNSNMRGKGVVGGWRERRRRRVGDCVLPPGHVDTKLHKLQDIHLLGERGQGGKGNGRGSK
jgi:hypothetical protein